MSGSSRAKAAREARRAAQFGKFRNTELNLIPLVDTFVSIVFFALTTATVGELAPVVPGVTLPSSTVGAPSMQELTIGIGNDISVAGARVMSTAEAAVATSNNPKEPLIIPQLLAVLQERADSIRKSGTGEPEQGSLKTPLAIQGDKTMRYDMLSRIMHTARWAGFKNVTLQVQREGAPDDAAAPATTTTS
jgi:biopolymer transport protein ExbD